MSAIATRPKPEPTGLPRASIEIEQLTPEQRRKGEQGTIRKIDCAHSWLRGMVDLIIVYFSNADGTFTLLGGGTATVDADVAPKFSFMFANSTVGVHVGTGSTAVNRDDDELATRILDGVTAGRLDHTNPGTLTKATAVTGGYRITLERSFANDSGGDITINEAGIAIVTRTTAPSSVVAPMILRDIISPGHLVVDGGAVIVRYFLDWLA